MTMPVETLISDILALPEADRIAVLHRVWDSLPESAAVFPLSEARKAELDRRIADMEANPDDEEEFDAAMADIRANP